MLYHVQDRARAFAEVRRVLQPGGRFFAATNGQGHLRELWQLEHEFIPEMPRQHRGFEVHRLMSSAFSLENGQAQLAPFFDEVKLHLYEDSLAVTEVEPLLSYITSSTVTRDYVSERILATIRDHVDKVIASRGAASYYQI